MLEESSTPLPASGTATEAPGAPVAAPTPFGREVTLADKYSLEEGRIILAGVQALVRVAFDQHRADKRRGLHTGTFISGYQGSPLGGLDKELQRHRKLCAENHVVHQSGLNEELGATSVWGSQLATQLPGPRYDGVLGMWYGKAPGLDRACDAIRHANLSGVGPNGGVLALVGDDPAAKSSTLPSASEATMASLMLPVLFPGNTQEVLDLGLHGFALSRASGLWCGMKVVTNVADGAGTVDVAPGRVTPVMPIAEWDGRIFEHAPSAHMLAPMSLEMERTMLNVRLRLAEAYCRDNRLNEIALPNRDAWLGIAAAGKTYHDLRDALRSLGLDDRHLQRAGIRLLKVGMVWPLEAQTIREFAHGLDEILVVEEKLPFLEQQIKEILYGGPQQPRIVGKLDERGERLLPAEHELDQDLIARAVGMRLAQRVTLGSIESRLREIDEAVSRARPAVTLQRTPFFCSGCPHNRSTAAPDGSVVGAGIGCHTMILLNPEGRGEIAGITQMGGEGAQFIGMAPFSETQHFFQNLGDGTFHHSGSLAIRAAAASAVNVTYKLFYNGTVAMTGGQDVEGQLTVPEMTRWLELEGVKQVVITSAEPERYRGADLAAIASVRNRDELLDVQEELAKVPGVTVLIHDGECAAERRRLRKRGKAPDPPMRVAINERVCEGCGDCGKKSNCLSVVPVDTEFGRKTQIHQPSCNKDYSCLMGDCPSFVTVIPGGGAKPAKKAFPAPPSDLPDPVMKVGPEDYGVRMVGIGGTGVVTIAQIVGMAAMLDGRHVRALDMTGLSQKGGPVVSDMRISAVPIDGANKIAAGEADLLMGFDVLGSASARNLLTASPRRTAAVVSTSAVPTGRMVIDTAVRFPRLSKAIDAIDKSTRPGDNVYLDAQALAERVFGDHMPGNAIVLGAAYQAGLLPIGGAAIEHAFRLNGASVDKNLAAFAWGRAVVAAPDAIEALGREEDHVPELDERAGQIVARLGATGELERLVSVRVPELVAYQDAAYAETYVDFLRGVLAAEEARTPGSTAVTEAVARQLFKLMAYKDEYEVARLHLLERDRIRDEFGPGTKMHWNLHPPALRALGLKRKLKFGAWFAPAFRMLRGMKRMRGRWYDPFGKAEVRRVERALIGEYRTLVEDALGRLGPATAPVVAELAELPDLVRGYEEIKLGNVELFRARAAELLAQIESGSAPVQLPVVQG